MGPWIEFRDKSRPKLTTKLKNKLRNEAASHLRVKSRIYRTLTEIRAMPRFLKKPHK